MKRRNNLSYMAFGGLLMLIGMLASSVFMPNLFAQKDKFGDIECTSLRIVDAGGNWKASLGVDEHGGYMRVYDSIGNRVLNFNGHGEVECTSLRIVDLLKNLMIELGYLDAGYIHIVGLDGLAKVRIVGDDSKRIGGPYIALFDKKENPVTKLGVE